MVSTPRSAVVLGARTLGGAIVDRLLADGWRVAAVARSPDTLAAVRARGPLALALRADAADPAEMRAALDAARDAHGGPDLIVNAVNASRPMVGDPFGGGPVEHASMETFRGWGVAVAEQAFVFLTTGIAALRAAGGGRLIQVTGGSSRQAKAGRGPWAAGAFATRALVHAAAQELLAEPIDPILLIVDGNIGGSGGELSEIADTVAQLARPRAHLVSHEIHLPLRGAAWTP
jgi:NAD(P)-dependent dehydrogenase (short-subunit alcohol dehydrogenase family)